MSYPSLHEFIKLTEKGNLIPVYKEILGDLDTPVSAYLKVAHQSKYSFLLESVEGEEKVARYSFLAKDPEIVFQSKDRDAEIIHFKNGDSVKNSVKVVETPLTFIREIMSQYRFVPIPGLPRFCGGMVGYVGYDIVRFFENLPGKPEDDLKLPDMIFMLARTLIIFDHLNHKIKIVSCAHVPEKSTPRQKTAIYKKAVEEIEALISQLALPLTTEQAQEKRLGKMASKIKVRSNVTEAQFKKMVAKAKTKIQAGDIIQVVLSQRLHTNLATDPLNVYRALRSVNPSPYMYYLNFNGTCIAGSSPELLVRCEEGAVETRPIAGTRKRGKSDAEDAALIKDLLSDPKERAEHTMLVDLGRNDLGRVCKKGTVRVSEFMTIEKYSHVMHIVSNVTGSLRPDKNIFNVLEAAFPAGTVSGAPKIRAMEIIDELENIARGPYAGCIGYVSFSGNLDSCITIRTIVISGSKAYVQAGAGIVADSDPKKEYTETLNKAKAQLMAIEMAYQ